MEEGIFCTHSRTSLADHGYMFASDVYRPHYRHIKMERLSNLKKKKKKRGPLEVILLRAHKKEGKVSSEH